MFKIVLFVEGQRIWIRRKEIENKVQIQGMEVRERGEMKSGRV
jgi:hypothetical protein